MKMEIGEDEEYLVWVKALLSLSGVWAAESPMPFYSLIITSMGKNLKLIDKGQFDY